jgi:hypothetical protein
MPLNRFFASLLLLLSSVAFAQAPQQAAARAAPVFYFGGKQFYVGMSKREAIAALSGCCELSPPVESEVEKRPSPAGGTQGHFIISKEKSVLVLGSIFFSEGKVASLSRDLDNDVDTFNEDLVAFMREFKRSLPEGDTSALVSLRHERMGNAESDVVTLVFPNGRGLKLRFATLDAPSKENGNRRDCVTLEETIQPWEVKH